MHDIVVFAQQHAALVVLFFAILGYVMWLELKQGGQSGVLLNPQACVQLINRERALVWDIRDEARYAAGHVVDAQRVPMDMLQATYGTLSKDDRQRPLIVVCQKGISAQKAAKVLQDAGHAHVHVLAGGMEAWQREGMPAVQA